jgi:hypothetical protein
MASPKITNPYMASNNTGIGLAMYLSMCLAVVVVAVVVVSDEWVK